MRESFGGETHLILEGIEAFRKSPLPVTELPIGVVKRSIAGVAGSAPVTIYVFNARPGRKRGGILYMHGGGYVLGSAGQDIGTCQDLATSLDCTVVSVDYRLAPEARYTSSLEDNYAALRWVHQNARGLGIDPRRIALVGESAGGGHATLLAIAARDRREVRSPSNVSSIPCWTTGPGAHDRCRLRSDRWSGRPRSTGSDGNPFLVANPEIRIMRQGCGPRKENVGAYARVDRGR